MADSDNFNEKIIDEFRTNDGKVGGYFDGQTLLLLPIRLAMGAGTELPVGNLPV